MKDKEAVGEILTTETKPIYLGKELQGYFIPTDSLQKILTLLSNDEDRE